MALARLICILMVCNLSAFEVAFKHLPMNKCNANVLKSFLFIVPYPFAGTYGPRRWASTYPECGERNQSPVDILDQDTRVSQECQELTLDGFETKSSNRTTMKNTGKTGSSTD